MKSKVRSLDVALDFINDNMSIGMGGILNRRRPIDLCHELATRNVRNLHVYSFLAGKETEILAASGAISTLTTGYVDPSSSPSETENALASGAIALREVSEHIFVGGLQAAASGLPFWPTLGGTGSDVATVNELRDVRCPYSGRKILTVPATPLDVALIHATAATSDGAVLGPVDREFLDDADLVLARAAKHVIVSVERIAEQHEATGGRNTVLAPFEVRSIIDLSARKAQ